MVETAKRILMKEKIDRQLAEQTSSTPFLNIREGYKKKVTFDMMDGIEQKIDKLTVMLGKLVTEDKGQNKQLNQGFTSLIEVEDRLDVTMTKDDFRTALG